MANNVSAKLTLTNQSGLHSQDLYIKLNKNKYTVEETGDYLYYYLAFVTIKNGKTVVDDYSSKIDL